MSQNQHSDDGHPPLEKMPLRARMGYVMKHATVKNGEMTPKLLITILEHKGALDDPDEDPYDAARDVVGSWAKKRNGGDDVD